MSLFDRKPMPRERTPEERERARAEREARRAAREGRAPDPRLVPQAPSEAETQVEPEPQVEAEQTSPSRHSSANGSGRTPKNSTRRHIGRWIGFC